MGYKDEDIEFANRLLTRREELSDEEVMTWLKEKDHVELLDEIATIRQKLSGQNYDETAEEEYLRLEKSVYDQKSRRMTLRWSIAASIILLVGLFVGRTINGVRDMHEEQMLVKNVTTTSIRAMTYFPTLPRLILEVWPDLPVTVV